jgi:hypothetical protein
LREIKTQRIYFIYQFIVIHGQKASTHHSSSKGHPFPQEIIKRKILLLPQVSVDSSAAIEGQPTELQRGMEDLKWTEVLQEHESSQHSRLVYLFSPNMLRARDHLLRLLSPSSYDLL